MSVARRSPRPRPFLPNFLSQYSCTEPEETAQSPSSTLPLLRCVRSVRASGYKSVVSLDSELWIVAEAGVSDDDSICTGIPADVSATPPGLDRSILWKLEEIVVVLEEVSHVPNAFVDFPADDELRCDDDLASSGRGEGGRDGGKSHGGFLGWGW